MIDRTAYVTAPVLTLDEGITLATTLADSVKPEETRENVLDAVAQLREVTADASAAQVEQAKRDMAAPKAGDAKSIAIDASADRSWRAGRMRLESAMLLPADHPDAAKAAWAYHCVFGSGGTDFLRLPHAAQLNQMKLHLVPIVGDENGENIVPGLRETIDEVAGEPYVTNILDNMPPYEAMVKARATTPASTAVALMPHLREVQEAIANFAMVVITNVKRKDPASLEAAKALLVPIDNARAKAIATLMAARRAGAAEAGGVVAADATAASGADAQPE